MFVVVVVVVVVVVWYSYIRSIFLFVTQLPSLSDGLYFLFWGFPTLTCFLFF